MAITVKQALSIGGLQHGRLLAGARHLDRVINHVNILEAPWEPFWETQDHLFLTSFYALKNDIPLQIENVKALGANGCAALVFQTGILDALDLRVIKQADESGLPLIEVDEAVDYSAIITPLVSAITHEKTFLLQRSQEIHRRLTDIILSGEGLSIVDKQPPVFSSPLPVDSKYADRIS
jgi:purine catabolism regulator